MTIKHLLAATTLAVFALSSTGHAQKDVRPGTGCRGAAAPIIVSGAPVTGNAVQLGELPWGSLKDGTWRSPYSVVTDRAGRPCPWVPLPMPLPLPDPWSVDFGRNRGGDRCTEPGMAYLDHENLDVYHVAIEFLPAANRIADAFPRGYSWLADQLRRAATSICLNIAEGAGEFSGKEKARFYRMAKRSATESAAILDAWRALGSPIEQGDELSSARDYIVRIVSMLVRMVQRVEQGHGVGHGQGHGHGHARARESDARTSGT